MSFLKKEKNIIKLETRDLKFVKGLFLCGNPKKNLWLRNARKKHFNTVSYLAVLKILHYSG